MSLILDALNKADREREQQPTAPAAAPSAPPTSHYAPHPAPRHWSAYVMLALLGVIVVLLVALLLKPTAPIVPVSIPAPAPAAPAPAPAAPAPLAASPVPAPTSDVQAIYQDSTAPDGEAVEGLYSDAPAPPSRKISPSKRRLLEDLDAEAAALDAEGSYQDLAPLDAPPARTAAKPPRPTEPPSPPPATDPLDPAEVKRLWEQTKKDIPDSSPNPHALQAQVQSALQNTLASYKDVPYLNELPARFQSSVPTLNYENHIYSEKGGAVMLNKNTYKTGDTLSAGLVLQRIASDGIILEFNGQRFKLAALNSWVNL